MMSKDSWCGCGCEECLGEIERLQELTDRQDDCVAELRRQLRQSPDKPMRNPVILVLDTIQEEMDRQESGE